MQVLIVDKNKPEKLFENAKKASKDLKEIEVIFVKEDSDFYELPLVVINNIIVSSGVVLDEKELKELFKNPPQGCSGSCSSCGGCS